MKSFMLRLASPKGYAFTGECVMLRLRGIDGDLAILAGHIPFVTAITAGECRIEMEDGSEKRFSTEGGLLSVCATGATVLAGQIRELSDASESHA